MHGVVDGDSIGEPCEGVDDVRGLMVLGQIGHFERVRAPVGPVQVSVEERQVVWVRDAHRQDCSPEMSNCQSSTSNDVKNPHSTLPVGSMHVDPLDEHFLDISEVDFVPDRVHCQAARVGQLVLHQRTNLKSKTSKLQILDFDD